MDPSSSHNEDVAAPEGDVTVSDEEERRSRSRVVALVVAIVIILLLLLCCWVSFWPLPGDIIENGDGGPSRIRGAGGLEIDGVTAREVPDVFDNRKGRAVLVSFRVRSDEDRVLDAGIFGLHVDRVELPPMPSSVPEVAKVQLLPATLVARRAVPVELVFSVPYGATEATLTVRPHEVPLGEGILVPVKIEPAGE